MKVKCIKVTLNNIEPLILFKTGGKQDKYEDDNIICSLDYYSIDKNISGYTLNLNSIYEVFGIMTLENRIRYLIFADNNKTAQWFPCDLFEIVDNRLPYNWYCGEFLSNSEKIRIISYKEISLDYSHLIGLLCQNKNDVEIFMKVKENNEILT